MQRYTMEVTCTACLNEYKYSERWFKTNIIEDWKCRKCKIKEKTRSPEFIAEACARSKAALSDPNVKARMSQMATLNNIKNAEKISESLKKYFKCPDAREKVSLNSLNNWRKAGYRKAVSDGLSNKWQDPEYSGKVLGSREHIRGSNVKLLKKLTDLGLDHEVNFILSLYEFDALIFGKCLYDENPSEEKRLFVEHYFPEYTYVCDLEKLKPPPQIT